MEFTPHVRPVTAPISAPEKASFVKPALHKKRWSKKWFAFLIAIVCLAVLIWWWWPRSQALTDFNSENYQAVFLTNGQVYFGQVSDLKGDYVTLKNIYYLRLREPLQTQGKLSGGDNSENKGEPTLVKFGTELHQPKDLMMINRDQILFIEELLPESKVTQAILDNQKKK